MSCRGTLGLEERGTARCRREAGRSRPRGHSSSISDDGGRPHPRLDQPMATGRPARFAPARACRGPHASHPCFRRRPSSRSRKAVTPAHCFHVQPSAPSRAGKPCCPSNDNGSNQAYRPASPGRPSASQGAASSFAQIVAPRKASLPHVKPVRRLQRPHRQAVGPPKTTSPGRPALVVIKPPRRPQPRGCLSPAQAGTSPRPCPGASATRHPAPLRAAGLIVATPAHPPTNKVQWQPTPAVGRPERFNRATSSRAGSLQPAWTSRGPRSPQRAPSPVAAGSARSPLELVGKRSRDAASPRHRSAAAAGAPVARAA